MRPRKTTVSVSIVKILTLYAERIGINARDALKAAGIDPKILKSGEARVSSREFILLWRNIVSAGKVSHPGLVLGRELALHYPAGSLLFTMMLNCERIGGALDVLVRYHRIMADAVQPVLDRAGETVSLSWRLQNPDDDEPPGLTEALMCVFHAILQTLSQNRIVPKKIRLSGSRPENIADYRRLFKAEVEFEAPENRMLLRARDLDLDIRLANPSLFAVLEKHASHLIDALGGDGERSDKVLKAISDLLASGAPPEAAAVARRLNVSTRGLQEKLKAEGTGFRTLLEEVRKRIALDRLQTADDPICELAFLLGYSDQSAFHRAFKRWTGRTPAAFRKSGGSSRFA